MSTGGLLSVCESSYSCWCVKVRWHVYWWTIISMWIQLILLVQHKSDTILSNVTCSHDIAEKLLIQLETIITHSLPAIYLTSYGCIFNLDIVFNLVVSSCTTFKIFTCFVLAVYLLLLLLIFFTCWHFISWPNTF